MMLLFPVIFFKNPCKLITFPSLQHYPVCRDKILIVSSVNYFLQLLIRKDQRKYKMIRKVCPPGSKSGCTVLAINISLNGCEEQPVGHDDSTFQFSSLQQHTKITYIREFL